MLVVMGALPGTAAAQTASSAFNAQTMRPTSDFAGMLSISSADVLPHMAVSSTFMVDGSLNPLSIQVPAANLPRADVVNRRFDAHALVAMGLLGRFTAGLRVPVLLHQGGVDTAFSRQTLGFSGLSAPRLGDLGLSGKAWLVTQDRWIPAVAAAFDMHIPTGSQKSFGGEPSATSDMTAILSQQLGRIQWAANLGYRFRPRAAYVGTSKIDDQFLYRAGVSYRVAATDARIARTVITELVGRTAVTSPFGAVSSPDLKGTDGLELRMGYRDRFLTDLGPMSVAIGAGVGLVRGFGVPLARGIISVDFVTEDPLLDSDGDTVPNAQDRCIDRPEDLDGFEDYDGCPDNDNDGDKIPDEDDECPNEPEDGVGSSADLTDGCPVPTIPDADGDGIDDNTDACPEQPEDIDSFEDWDGCPEADNDGDGLDDLGDLCPLAPEDKNNFEDDDGCPDGGKRARFVSFKDDRIVLHRALAFTPKTTDLAASAGKIIDQLSAVLRKFERLERIRIVVYPGKSGKAQRNQALQRARRVVDELKKRSITADRLLAVGPNYERKKAGMVEIVIDKIRRATKKAAPTKKRSRKKKRRGGKR